MKINIIENWPSFNRHQESHEYYEGQPICFHKETIDIVTADMYSIEFWAK